ncbi:MAG TPA: T9SS type A sorting domain-containing protein, partial [Bacteroidia bacterium]|nr:T9SS type A sorting domain-containing protein [Bacteroidia bacterium]
GRLEVIFIVATNYYSYQTANLPLQGAGHNWQNETDPVPAANMEYDHVARAILGGNDGVQGSLPANITSGGTYSWTFNYNIPATQNVSNLIIIGWVSDFATGRILNANSATVTTGIHNLTGTYFNMNITPNPITSDYGQVRVNLKKNADVVFEIIDVLGNIVRTNYQSQMSSGEYVYPVNFTGLSNGIYTVRMNASGETLTQKVVLNR